MISDKSVLRQHCFPVERVMLGFDTFSIAHQVLLLVLFFPNFLPDSFPLSYNSYHPGRVRVIPCFLRKHVSPADCIFSNCCTFCDGVVEPTRSKVLSSHLHIHEDLNKQRLNDRANAFLLRHHLHPLHSKFTQIRIWPSLCGPFQSPANQLSTRMWCSKDVTRWLQCVLEQPIMCASQYPEIFSLKKVASHLIFLPIMFSPHLLQRTTKASPKALLLLLF